MGRLEAPSWSAIREASDRPAGYLYTRYVNRKAARYVTWTAARVGLTPNALSLLSALLTIVGAAMVFAARAETAQSLWAYAALALGYVFDAADGQLARSARVKSRAGQFLDHSLDGAKTPLVMAAIGYAYHVHAHGPLVVGGTAWPGLALVTIASWHFSVTWQKDAILKDRASWIRPAFSAGYLLRTPFDYGVVLMWLPAVVLVPAVATVPFQVFVAAYGLFVLALFAKGYRDIMDLPG